MMKEVEFDSLCELISERLGIEVRGRDRKRVQAALATRCQDRKLEGPEQYARLLSARGRDAVEEWQRLASLLTTGETFFFRDRGHFRVLRQRILPELIALRRAEKSLRVWSAGCASGEEPYSLAMLLEEVLPAIDRWHVLILGTDIDAEALDKARRGIYTEWSFRNVDRRTRDKYFHPHCDDWEINSRIKQRVTFKSLNLLTDPIPGSAAATMDLIVCRNVFIYFKPERVAEAVAKLAKSLRTGGYLLTGHGELHGLDIAWLERTVFEGAVVYRKLESPRLLERDQQMSHEPMIARVAPQPGADVGQPLVGSTATVDQRVEPPLTERDADVGTVLAEIEQLLARNDCRGALQRAERAVAADAHSPQLDYLMARAHADLGQHRSAIDACQRAIAADAFAVQPHYLLAHIAEEQGRFEDAARLLKKVIYLDPSHLDAHLALAAHCQRQGDMPQATRLRRAAIALLQEMPEDALVGEAGDLTAGRLIRHLQETATDA